VSAVVLGVGNAFRRDDGIGPALAEILGERGLPDVTVLSSDGDPGFLLDAWAGARLAIVVDALWCENPVPGRIHRIAETGIWPQAGQASTHGLGIAETVKLGQALGRMPGRLVIYGVEAEDDGFGPGLSAAVTAALPGLAEAVLAELAAAQDAAAATGCAD